MWKAFFKRLECAGANTFSDLNVHIWMMSRFF